MPFANDPGIRENDQYCSLCFNNGKLCYEGTDLVEFQKYCYQNMIAGGMNPIKAKILTWIIRFAPRWKINNNFHGYPERYISEYSSELGDSGYEVLAGNRLKKFKKMFAKDIDVPRKTTNLGVFSFKALLNLGMLLAESERARLLRSLILDIVIDVVNKKAGGSTKYINQRDEGYLLTLYVGENYHKEFINTLQNFVDI
jgi:hypothetical protein